MWVDYIFYINEYSGTLSEQEFRKASMQAQAYINRITFGRIAEPVENYVKFAVCAAAELMHESSGREGISSESNDGYSVSYTSSTDLQRNLYATVTNFLPCQLLYRGVRP